MGPPTKGGGRCFRMSMRESHTGTFASLAAPQRKMAVSRCTHTFHAGIPINVYNFYHLDNFHHFHRFQHFYHFHNFYNFYISTISSMLVVSVRALNVTILRNLGSTGAAWTLLGSDAAHLD